MECGGCHADRRGVTSAAVMLPGGSHQRISQLTGLPGITTRPSSKKPSRLKKRSWNFAAEVKGRCSRPEWEFEGPARHISNVRLILAVLFLFYFFSKL